MDLDPPLDLLPHPPLLDCEGHWMGVPFEIGGPIRPQRIGGRRWSRAALVDTARRAAAAQPGEPLTQHDFLRFAKASSPTIYLYFPGGWPELLAEAGLDPAPAGGKPTWTDEELLAEYGRVRTDLGRVPTGLELDRLATPSLSTFRSRLGGLRKLETMWRQRVTIARNTPQ